MRFFPEHVFLNFVLIVLSAGLFLWTASPMMAQQLPRKAIEKAIEAENFEQAEILVRSVLSENPKHERALGYMIQIVENQQNQEATYRYYRRLADRPPDEFRHFSAQDVYYHTGILAYQNSEYDQAIRYINRAQSQLSEDEEVLYERMQGWKLRARAAQERLAGQQLKEQRRRTTHDLARLLINREWKRAQEYLNPEIKSMVGEEVFRSLNRTLQYYLRMQQFHKQSQRADELSSQELENEIAWAQDVIQGDSIRKLLSPFSSTDRKKLRELHQKLIEEWIRPGLSVLSQTRAIFHFDQGQWSEALDSFLRARSYRQESDPELSEYLTRTHYRMGNYFSARQQMYEWKQLAGAGQVDRLLDWKIWMFNRGPLFIGFIVVVLGVLIGGWFLIRRYSGEVLTTMGSYLGRKMSEQGWDQLAYWFYRLLCEPEEMTPTSLRGYISVCRSAGYLERRQKLLSTGYESGRLTPEQVVEWGRVLKGNNDPKAKDVLESALSDWKQLSRRARESLAISLSQNYLDEGDNERAYKLLRKLVKTKKDDSRLYRRVTRLASTLGHWDDWARLAHRWHRFVSDAFVQSSNRRTIGETSDEKKLADPEQVAAELLDQYQESDRVLRSESPERLELLLEWVRDVKTSRLTEGELLEQLVNRDLSEDKMKQYGLQRAHWLVEQERSEEVSELLEHLKQQFPSDLEVLSMLGQQYTRADHRQPAYDVNLEILEIQTDNVPARKQLEQLGRRYEDDENYEEAEKFYRAILEYSSFQKPQVQMRLGTVLYKQEKVDEALSVFQRIYQGESAFQAKIMSFIARCLVDLEMFDIAEERIDEIDLEDGAIPAQTRRLLHYWKARAREGAGKIDGALDSYRQIIGSDVDFRDVADRVSRLQKESYGSGTPES